MQINPNNDGIDHINVYSKGKTALGRMLTNMADIGFDHPEHGKFRSMESFWYWYVTGRKHDGLKLMKPFEAKKEGKELLGDSGEVLSEEDKKEIIKAIRLKIQQNKSKFFDLMRDSDIPFKHYYWYGNENGYKVIELPQYEWMIKELERIRHIIKTKNLRVGESG